MRTIGRILALCLCLVLLAGAAGAEETRMICSGRPDELDFACTLPDGRLLLTGVKDVDVYDSMRAWVLCVNPDATVSWEIVDRDEKGYQAAGEAAVLPDGTVAVAFGRYEGSLRKNTIRFYTQDGQPTGRELVFPEEYSVSGLEPSRLMLFVWDDQSTVGETVVMDWDGNELLRYDGAGMPGAYGRWIENTDGLVIVGQDAPENARAKIMKMDGLTKEAAWENTLDRRAEDTDWAALWWGAKTEDGGYAAWLMEDSPLQEDGSYDRNNFLVKFDAEGRIQWTSGESFEKKHMHVSRVFSWNGKIAVCCLPEQESPDGFDPWIFFWFDEDGKELGTTEVKLGAEDHPVMSRYLVPEDPETKRKTGFSYDMPIAMEDGLWALAVYTMYDVRDAIYDVFESREIFLVKIPEP